MRRTALRSHQGDDHPVILRETASDGYYDDCEGLNSHAMAYGTGRVIPTVTRREVQARGLTPCGVCLPPPILTVVDLPLEGT